MGIIIHIAGPAGSGKTYIGKKIQNICNCTVKDLDDLWNEYTSELNKIPTLEYQEYIDDFIEKHNVNPIVFVGIDANKCLPNPDGKSEHVDKYNFHTNYLLYLRPELQSLITRRFSREVDKLASQASTLIKKYFEGDKEKIMKKILRKVDINFMIQNIGECDKIYESYGYKFMTYDECFEYVQEIILPEVGKPESLF